ncbi:MAG: carbohydrate kinase family protein [Clostridiales bacterium]|nr:carbohydrate kinase family protein [Clostridiales bacterium]
MTKFLVSGLLNIETTLKIKGFPIEYEPVSYPFLGIDSSVSGVGMNIGKALHTLGDDVSLLSIIGRDMEADNIITTMKEIGVDCKYLLKGIDKTPRSVILYDDDGKRQIFTDLKDIQETNYPQDKFMEALKECDVAVLANINFSRPFLQKARELNKPIVSDVHVVNDIHDSYNSDFMKYANVLFMSHEKIEGPVEYFAEQVLKEYNNDILVVGMGAEGALLCVRKDNFMGRFPAVKTRKVVNTVGAGDSLLSSFIHFYFKNYNPYEAIKKAIIFASYKIGEKGAANGFLQEETIESFYKERYK